MSNPLLPAECWVERLAAQRRPVVFPFYRDPDGAGHAERLRVVLLGYHTWREKDTMMKGKKTGGVAKNQASSQNIPVFPLSLRRHHAYDGREREREKGRTEGVERGDF